MAQHECVFDFSLLGPAKLPPHDACKRCSADDGPDIYTLHWYTRLAAVIQAGGQVLLMNPGVQLHCATLQEAMPSMIWLLGTDATNDVDDCATATAVLQ